jgi:uncharacterized protein
MTRECTGIWPYHAAMPPAPFPPKALIGMVHVRALPGSPRGHLSIDEIVSIAADEARLLADTGFDAVIIENMHDRPYVHGDHGPETVAAMTRVGLAVRDAAPDLPLGVQILSGGNREAVAIAAAVGASFIRCENFVFAHVADEGVLLRAEAGTLLRYRKQIGAESVRIFADIKKKHASHAITADVSIAEAAEAAEFFGADGVIVTGTATGRPAALEEVAAVADATDLPLLVGSGVTPELAASLLRHADGVIVGSAIKQGGLWSNPIDADRCRAMVEAVLRARN